MLVSRAPLHSPRWLLSFLWLWLLFEVSYLAWTPLLSDGRGIGQSSHDPAFVHSKCRAFGNRKYCVPQRRSGSIALQGKRVEESTSLQESADEIDAIPTSPRRSLERSLMKEMSSTPGMAGSATPDESKGSGGIRLFFAPARNENVAFALWFGPFPCFQVGTFRMCL